MLAKLTGHLKNHSARIVRDSALVIDELRRGRKDLGPFMPDVLGQRDAFLAAPGVLDGSQRQPHAQEKPIAEARGIDTATLFVTKPAVGEANDKKYPATPPKIAPTQKNNGE